MGHCLVVYDIPHDRTRSRVADLCLDYGLDRIQYSAFLGTLTRTHQEELMLRLKRLLGKREGNIQLFPLCQKDWQARQVIENREEEDNRTPVAQPDEDVLTPEERAFGVEAIDL